MADVLTLAGWTDVLGTVWTWVLVAIGFSAVIFVHELGHFLVAKKVGIRVERFAIGFGPRLFGVRRGETDYCLNILPLGGYVKMTGQEDFQLEKEAEPDPRAYNNKSVGARMAVVAAGVVMNVVFAVVGFTVAFMVGVEFPPNKVGAVAFDSAAWGHVQPGDTILSIDGERTDDFVDVAITVALSDAEELPVLVRHADGREELLRLTPRPGQVQGLRSIGVEMESTLKVPAKAKAKDLEPFQRFLADGELRGGDRIVAAAAGPNAPFRKVEYYSDLVRVCRSADGRLVPIRIERDGQTVAATLRPALPGPDAGDALQFLGAHPLLAVVEPQKEGPADGVLEKGDVILRIGEQAAPYFKQFTETVDAHGGQPLGIQVLRGAQTVDVTLTPTSPWWPKRPKVGVAMELSDAAVVGQIDADSVLGRADLPTGARVLAAIDAPAGEAAPPEFAADAPTMTWAELYRALKERAGRPVTLWYRLGDGAAESVQFDAPAADTWPALGLFGPPPLPLEVYKAPYAAGGNPLRAAWMGVQKTRQFIVQAYVTVVRLISSESIGLKHLSGPVGIAAASYQQARSGPINLLYFLALISASLAVVNFLPLPIVDGGLMVFLIIEKVRRRPVSVKVMQATQIVGFVLLTGLFLLITWQDILRLLPG